MTHAAREDAFQEEQSEPAHPDEDRLLEEAKVFWMLEFFQHSCVSLEIILNTLYH